VGLIGKKTRGRKSRATVPLKGAARWQFSDVVLSLGRKNDADPAPTDRL
jgi:hypothetical protein